MGVFEDALTDVAPPQQAAKPGERPRVLVNKPAETKRPFEAASEDLQPAPTKTEQPKPDQDAPALFTRRFEAVGPVRTTAGTDRMVIGQLNQLPAAAQLTTPDVEAHRKNYVSSEVFEGDDGNYYYRNLDTGKVVPTDINKHVVLTDPDDNRLKVFNRTEDTNEGRLSALGRFVSFGLATGSPMVSAAPRIVEAKQAAPTIQELKLAAAEGFAHPDVSALEIHPDAVKTFSQSSQHALNADGIDEMLAPKTFGILQKFEKVPDGAVVTGRNVQTMRRTLGHAAASPDATERLAASTAIDHLDSWLSPTGMAQQHVLSGDIEKASKILENARGNYSAAMHAETIDKKAIQAELRAAAANSGQNVSNTIRQRMADILLKPKERRGFTADELGQMETIVRGTKTQNTMRYAGNVMGGGGGLGAAIVGGGSTLAAGPVGMAVPIAGYALKTLSNRMTLSQAAKLSESIRGRSPLASSMQKYEESAQAFQSGRSGQTIARLNIASRNLANNLKELGISINPAEFIRGAQTPAGADEDNNPGPRGQ